MKCHLWGWEQKQLILCTEKSGLEREGNKEKGEEKRLGGKGRREEVVRREEDGEEYRVRGGRMSMR